MAKKRGIELSDLTIDELNARQEELHRQVFALRNELSIQRKLEKPHLLKEIRHERARLLMILSQKRGMA